MVKGAGVNATALHRRGGGSCTILKCERAKAAPAQMRAERHASSLPPPLAGASFQSPSFGWCCFPNLTLWMVLLSPSGLVGGSAILLLFGWCCFRRPPFAGGGTSGSLDCRRAHLPPVRFGPATPPRRRPRKGSGSWERELGLLEDAGEISYPNPQILEKCFNIQLITLKGWV